MRRFDRRSLMAMMFSIPDNVEDGVIKPIVLWSF